MPLHSGLQSFYTKFSKWPYRSSLLYDSVLSLVAFRILSLRLTSAILIILYVSVGLFWFTLLHTLCTFCPFLLPSPPALNLSQHQGLFQWLSSSHRVAKVLELQLQHPSFQWIFRVDFLKHWLVWSLCCPSELQESFPRPQFKSINSSALSVPYGPTVTSIQDYWKKQ